MNVKNAVHISLQKVYINSTNLSIHCYIFKELIFNRCASIGSQRPRSELLEPKKARTKDQGIANSYELLNKLLDTQTSDSFVKLQVPNDEEEIKKEASFVKSDNLLPAEPKRSSTIKVYFRDNRTLPAVNLLIAQ